MNDQDKPSRFPHCLTEKTFRDQLRIISVIDIWVVLGICPCSDTEHQHKHSNQSKPGEFWNESDPNGPCDLYGHHGDRLSDKPIVDPLCDSASPLETVGWNAVGTETAIVMCV